MPFVAIIPEESLQKFIRPAIDLQTGQIIELYPEVEPMVQLELFDNALSGYLLDLSRLVTTTGM